MSENILSLEDLKFLEDLHHKHGVHFLRCDDSGIFTDQEDINSREDSGFDAINYLTEISKKLKYRLNSNFQLNLSSGFKMDVVKM